MRRLPMSEILSLRQLKSTAPSWPTDISRIRKQLGAPGNRTLFPEHFLQVTFPRIGGRVLLFQRDQELIAVGFAFPAPPSHEPTYVVRLHALDPLFAQAVVRVPELRGPGLERLAAETLQAPVQMYDPRVRQEFAPTTKVDGGIDIGRPNQAEAESIPRLQAEIWGSEPEQLYPADIHSKGFPCVQTLVARAQGNVIGFLFGFYKLAENGSRRLPEAWRERVRDRFRLESQALGVLPLYRSRGVATALKAEQARQARLKAVDVVNWTVDPLQFGNAVLNYRHLRAVAFEFFPDHYGFRNELNRVTASRLGITWLVNSNRVQAALARPGETHPLDLDDRPHVKRLIVGSPGHSNERHLSAFQPLRYFQHADPALMVTGDRSVAVEVPRNWTRLQAEMPEEAWRWRVMTDRLFKRLIGCRPGQYMVTEAATSGERCFIILERVTVETLEELAREAHDGPCVAAEEATPGDRSLQPVAPTREPEAPRRVTQ